MDTTLVRKKFEEMGARVKFNPIRNHNDDPEFNIDIRKDKKGEYFEIRSKDHDAVDALIADVNAKDRHLLMFRKRTVFLGRQQGHKAVDTHRFLCGHDERNWFTAAVPKGQTVYQAKQSLKPRDLVEMEAGNIKTKNAQKRHRKLKDGTKIHRQGEFMFIPMPNMKVSSMLILKKERLAQRGNPHVADELYRRGGKPVWVTTSGMKSITDSEYDNLSKDKRSLYRQMRENPDAFVRGKIRHPEHATLDLGCVWHRVLVNTESRALGANNVRFID